MDHDGWRGARRARSLRRIAPIIGLLASCGVTERPLEGGESCDLSPRTLTLTPGDLAFDGDATVEVSGAPGGEEVWFWWTREPDTRCSCPAEVEGCLDLDQPELLGSAIADDEGVARLTVALPPDAPAGAHRIQASTIDQTSAVVNGVVEGPLRGDRELSDAHYIVTGVDGLSTIAGVGDLDGDGRAELLLGVPQEGVAYVVDPTCCVRPGLPITEAPAVTTLVGPPSTGWAATGVGDVNGDGYGDLVVSAPEAGRVWLLHGPLPGGEHAIEAIAARTLAEPGAGTHLTTSDIDGDGVVDIVISGPDRVWITSGDSLGPRLTLPGLHAPSVTAAGDLDGDGLGDLAIASGDEIVLLFGPGIEEPGLWMPGARLAGAGDVDGDGFDDVWVGGPDALDERGVAALMYGPLHPLAPVVEGSTPGERLGERLASAGDLDGDGQGDLIVHSASGGAVLVLYGPPGSARTPQDADARLAVPSPGPLAGPGDLDGDGYADLVVGSLVGGSGSVHVFRGGPGR